MAQIKIKDFNLKETVECGQLFRWQLVDSWYYIVARDKLFRVRQEGSKLKFNGASTNFVKHFFRLDDDYNKIIRTISKDAYIKKAVEHSRGLRIIRYDPWEALISFVCSARSNIPQIRRNLNNLSKTFGKRISLGSYKTYTFPNPGSLNNLNKIRKCGVGFRDRYLFKINKMADEKKLKSLKKLSYEDAKTELIKFPGVGHKVADCIQLYSLEFLNAFPVDVWLERLMKQRYKKDNIPEMREFSQTYFGKYAGYAQQYLFHYTRCICRKI
jgi:N-glycosylase/DNA lyase